MSHSRKQVRREKRLKKQAEQVAAGTTTAEDIKYEANIRRKIKQGKLDKYHFVKHGDGTLPKDRVKGYTYDTNTKEIVPKIGGLRLITVSTLHTLTKKV